MVTVEVIRCLSWNKHANYFFMYSPTSGHFGLIPKIYFLPENSYHDSVRGNYRLLFSSLVISHTLLAETAEYSVTNTVNKSRPLETRAVRDTSIRLDPSENPV